VSKRVLDVFVALVSLVALSPVFGVVSFLVKVSSPGPVFFRQERVGRLGKPFEIYKFRSMIENSAAAGLSLTVGDDARITPLGRFLRRSKLDELPQLINVLRGDMSLVGPRPELPKYVAHYPHAARERILSIRPGITDPAAVELGDEAQLLGDVANPELTYLQDVLPWKIQMYERYVETRSFSLDFRIMARTLSLMIHNALGERAQPGARETVFSRRFSSQPPSVRSRLRPR
jgi:lipopolysaccharide/colanic/teichoic acid biosynthesis glycosyltransferase